MHESFLIKSLMKTIQGLLLKGSELKNKNTWIVETRLLVNSSELNYMRDTHLTQLHQ